MRRGIGLLVSQSLALFIPAFVSVVVAAGASGVERGTTKVARLKFLKPFRPGVGD